ncbi:MAG: hypothetical protein ACTSPI_01420 [Candidatus Heimdallarchaeaceae archaeon]
MKLKENKEIFNRLRWLEQNKDRNFEYIYLVGKYIDFFRKENEKKGQHILNGTNFEIWECPVCKELKKMDGYQSNENCIKELNKIQDANKHSCGEYYRTLFSGEDVTLIYKLIIKLQNNPYRE